MRSKEQLLEDIEELPIFKLTEAYTKNDGEYVEQRSKAVVEVEGVDAVAFVSPRYILVQFSEIFEPIVTNIPECSGRIQTYGGFARMVLFPKVETEDSDKWGMIAMNSVDKTSSVIIKFCVKQNERTITLPNRIAGYIKPHSTKAAINTQDFISVVTKVKEQWKHIVEKFATYNVTADNIQDILTSIKMKEKGFVKNTMKILDSGMEYTLWDFFMDLIDHVSDKKYKSEIHKNKRLDKICEGIINHSYMLRI